MKKVLSMIVILCILFSGLTVNASEISNTKSLKDDSAMDTLDLMLVAHRYLVFDKSEEWDTVPDIQQILPLYDDNERIIAYYLQFETNEYIVINNNRNNPIPIEFGKSGSPYVENLLDSQRISGNSQHIIYYGPACYENETERRRLSSEGEKQYNEFKQFLASSNSEEARLHNEQKALVRGDGNYGFIYDINDLPTGSCTYLSLYLGVNPWATTYIQTTPNGDCGAVCATNIALYYSSIGHTNMKVSGATASEATENTYYQVYSYIGDGPVASIAGGFSSYASSRGYNLSYTHRTIFFSYDTYKNAIASSSPVGLLLCNALLDWHWVFGVGYRDYSSGGHYVRIVDGWNNSADTYYLWNSGSTILAMTEFGLSLQY